MASNFDSTAMTTNFHSTAMATNFHSTALQAPYFGGSFWNNITKALDDSDFCPDNQCLTAGTKHSETLHDKVGEWALTFAQTAKGTKFHSTALQARTRSTASG